MSEPLSIKIFHAKGLSSGSRTAEISNWSGKAWTGKAMEMMEDISFIEKMLNRSNG